MIELPIPFYDKMRERMLEDGETIVSRFIRKLIFESFNNK